MNSGDLLIWDSDPDYEEWREDLEKSMPDASEEERRDVMHAANRDALQFGREELAYRYPREILVIARLDLWDGRRDGYREIKSGQLADCFEAGRDTLSVRWYLDRRGDLRCDDTHHDGTNHYLYRVWRKGVGDERKQRLKAKILDGTVTRDDIARATERLGDEIGRVYGWTFPDHLPDFER